MKKIIAIVFILALAGSVAQAAVITPEKPAKTTIIKTDAELDAKLSALTNTIEAYICKTQNEANYTEKHTTTDPKHHVWEVRSTKTGKAIRLHFYPEIDPVKQGFINADALE